jgi:hypothetical protein
LAGDEAEVKAQFARVFVSGDWSRFKRMAEFYLRRAVYLQKRDMDVSQDLQLLARNCVKRLFIGVGMELLVKSVYLHRGFSINMLEPPTQPGVPSVPFTFQQVAGFTQSADRTYKFDVLIPKLAGVLGSGPPGELDKGLKVAKVFRNKEGHGVLSQKFDRSSYTAVEVTLSELYSRAWGQRLTVRFSLTPHEKGLWRLQ